MNGPLIDTLRQMDDDETEIQVSEHNAPMRIRVGHIDKDAAKILHVIRTIFGELANDPDWVMALLNAAQFWLTLGCALMDAPPEEKEEKFRLIGEDDQIPAIPRRNWHG